MLAACTGSAPEEGGAGDEATLEADVQADVEAGHEAALEADRDAVEEVQTAFTEAANREDIEGVMRFYTDESVLLPPDGGIIRGREAIREHFERHFVAADSRVGIEPSEIRVSGDLAFSTGRSGGVMIEGATSDTISVFSRYLMVLERQADEPERWTILRWMWQVVDPV